MTYACDNEVSNTENMTIKFVFFFSFHFLFFLDFLLTINNPYVQCSIQFIGQKKKTINRYNFLIFIHLIFIFFLPIKVIALY